MEKTPKDDARAAVSPGTESVSSLDDDDIDVADAPSLSPGSLIARRYRIDSPLGKGGYAVVYRAHDLATESDVALKILRVGRLGPSALTRMAREAETARRFNHPRLVRVLDQGRDGEHAFLAMELVEGETLRARLGRGPVALEAALAIAADILEALAVLHANGIVHRDIKPSNVLLDRDGRGRLGDFGLVTRWTDDQTRATQSHAIVGTLDYVSPEQALGEGLDGQSDLYSLGVLLYETLSGTTLHGARSSLGALVAHLTRPAPDVRQSRAGIPDWLAAVVARLLAKSRNERYASADEVLNDLRNRRPPRAPRGPDSRGRRRARPLATAAVVTLGVLVGSVWIQGRSPGATTAQVVTADVAAGVVRALDDKGRVLWSKATGEPLSENTFSPSALARFPRLAVADLEGDGINEVLVTAAAEAGGLRELLIFEGDGRIRLRYHPRHQATFGGALSDTFSATYLYPLVDRMGRRRLFLTWTHRPNFPCILEEISPTGLSLGTYTFGGHQQVVSRLVLAGREVLAVGGFHNETRGGSVTLLDLDQPVGRSPGANPRFVCQDCPQADPLGLVVFPRSDILVAEAGATATAQVDAVISLEAGVIDAVLQLGATPNAFGQAAEATIRYQVAPDLSRVVGMDVSKLVQVRHDILFRAHQLDHAFGPRDLADLRKVIVWKNGGWTPLPFVSDPS